MMSHRMFTRTTTTSIDRQDDETIVLIAVLQDNVHDVTLRVTVDADLRILDAEGDLAASPYTQECGRVSPIVERLVGMQIGPGFSKEATQRLGGPMGCHRYVDLVREIARNAAQIPFLLLFHSDDRPELQNVTKADNRRLALRHVPNLENSCWTYNRQNDALFEVAADA